MVGIIDHLVVVGDTLDAASDFVEAGLGVAMAPGGAHTAMGTHNRLLSLGPADYLEAIAIDPAARAPRAPRWFGLDGRNGPARLSNWVLRVEDMEAALALAPGDIGAPLELERGPYHWHITVPSTGILPFDGVFPALIEWHGDTPAPALPDGGVRLVSLTVSHPNAGALGWALSMLTSDDRVIVREGPPGLRAHIHTLDGEIVL